MFKNVKSLINTYGNTACAIEKNKQLCYKYIRK